MSHACPLPNCYQKAARTAALLTVVAVIAGCSKNQPELIAKPVASKPTAAAHIAPFIDATVASGLTFEHTAHASPDFYLPEIIGAGVALLDYDKDGDLDIYLIQGGHPVSSAPGEQTNRLYRNELSERGELFFSDVTDTAGLNHNGYGMGAAGADIDNDGDTDLYLTNVGENVLYRNEGDGRFTDITATAGVDHNQWSASASFSDYDKDGYVDLFVTHYVANSITGNRPCENMSAQRDYCSPTLFEATSDSLFRNLGNGKFHDVSDASGIAEMKAAGLGVISADFDSDGFQDFFVANDQSANFLWHNLGNGTFEETGLISGSAYNKHGKAEASMGVTAADYDMDGDEDLFMTHMNAQTNTLYQNNGNGSFVDATAKARLGSASLPFTGFGSKWFDADNDGDQDLFIANGSVLMEPGQIGVSDFPYAQRNQFFVNQGDGRYQQWQSTNSDALHAFDVSRGAAVGDIDNDGDLDIVVSNSNGPAQLLLNSHNSASDWLGLTLRGTQSNRDGTGARIALLQVGERTQWYRAHSDGSYLSANDARVHIGGLQGMKEAKVAVIWPLGLREYWILPSGQYSELVEGNGTAWPLLAQDERE